MLSGFNLIQLFIIISVTAFKNNSNLSLNIDEVVNIFRFLSIWGCFLNSLAGDLLKINSKVNQSENKLHVLYNHTKFTHV